MSHFVRSGVASCTSERSEALLHKIKRTIIRFVKNPLFELRGQYYNVRDFILVRKIVSGDVYFKFRGELYSGVLTGGNAAAFIRKTAKFYCHGKGLDIGPGKWPLTGAIPVENELGQNAFNLDNFEDNTLDFVFSSHCLEHLKRWEDALSVWIRKLKAGGILFLYLPHESMKMWRPGGPWARHHHVWIPTVKKINPFLTQNGMDVLEYNSGKDDAWGFHIVAKKL
jgi:SAM-dependent methyltransferase